MEREPQSGAGIENGNEEWKLEKLNQGRDGRNGMEMEEYNGNWKNKNQERD
jgi:hypothetical protein